MIKFDSIQHCHNYYIHKESSEASEVENVGSVVERSNKCDENYIVFEQVDDIGT